MTLEKVDHPARDGNFRYPPGDAVPGGVVDEVLEEPQYLVVTGKNARPVTGDIQPGQCFGNGWLEELQRLVERCIDAKTLLRIFSCGFIIIGRMYSAGIFA